MQVEMAPWEKVVLTAYYAVLVVLAVYGMHRYKLVYLYYRHKKHRPAAAGEFDTLPRVAVQLPIFNEATVVERLVDAVCAIDYPRDRLEIQVLDDSIDETVEIAATKVAAMRALGHNIHHIHRADRSGFKAGALEAGLTQSDAEFVAIFDADFVPQPDVLMKTVHHFTDPKIGMVQVRWGHLNRRFSLLTRLQSIFLDGHFVIEHAARNWSGRFFNFNGTAGIWRRQCIQEAGGWQHDTLTEDLDLSYRAQLKGWRFRFLQDVVSPGELPVEMNAFKSQQHRWAKGSIQVCRKLLPTIWRSDAPFKAKVEATFHLTNNFAYVLMIVLSLLMLPALLARLNDTSEARGAFFDLSLFLAASASVVSFYLASQREAYSDWKSAFKYIPQLIALGIGISVNNAKAVVEAVVGHQTPFVRTPKYNVPADGVVIAAVPGSKKTKKTKRTKKTFRYVGSRQGLPYIELFLAAYFAVVTSIAAWNGLILSTVFLSLFFFGFCWVGVASLTPSRESAPIVTPAVA